VGPDVDQGGGVLLGRRRVADRLSVGVQQRAAFPRHRPELQRRGSRRVQGKAVAEYRVALLLQLTEVGAEEDAVDQVPDRPALGNADDLRDGLQDGGVKVEEQLLDRERVLHLVLKLGDAPLNIRRNRGVRVDGELLR
jgi:hypothetical protein